MAFGEREVNRLIVAAVNIHGLVNEGVSTKRGTTVIQYTVYIISLIKSGAPWISGLVGHFVQAWPDSECSHTVQCLDCGDLN